MSQELTNSSPFISRFFAWSNERFPAANIISGALSYTTMVSIGKHVAGFSLSLTWLDLLGALAFTAHLLLLRIFDEHKDYAVDKINYPERALSKGLITLQHLKFIALPLPLLAIIWSVYTDNGIGTVSYLWIIMFTYSALMAKEFFIGEWLVKRLVLYSFSHMIVSPMMILWIIAGGMKTLYMTETIWIMMILAFTGGIAYELTRKTRGTDEDTNLDAYNKHFGVKGSIGIITLMNLISFISALQVLLTIREDISVIAYIVLALGYTCTFYPTINFIKKQTEKARKINEGGIGLLFLGLYASLLCALFI